MRIIAGTLKNRNFYMPQGIRPTPDKARKAVFDILGQDLGGASFLDLFAGSGAMGLEAVSRGAGRVLLVEREDKCTQVINENLNVLKLKPGALSGQGPMIIGSDVFMTIKQLHRRGEKFDICFFDPPFDQDLAKKTLKSLNAYDIVHPNCIIIAQHSKREILPEVSGRFLLVRQKNTERQYSPSIRRIPVAKRAIYPGTFDPITYGHLDLIKRATQVFDEVIIAVAEHTSKKALMSSGERLSLVQEATAGLKGVTVMSFGGLIVDFARKQKAQVIIRGLRMISDFEYEFQMALTNRRLAEDIETVYLMPSEGYSFLSSTLIKEAASLGADVSTFVPEFVEKKIKQRLKK